MNERSILYMETLAELGSVSRSAEQLYITPAALSKYIITLEREYGTALFSRIGNHFVLTHAGERYLDWCRKIHLLSDQMKSEMGDLAREEDGKIRIGIQTSISDFIITRVMPDFARQYPHICVSLTEDTGHRVLELVKQYKLEAAVTTRPPESEDFYREPLMEFENIILVPQEHPLARRAIPREGYPYPWIDLEWCRGEKFIAMHPEQGPRKAMERVLKPIWEDIRIVMEVRSLQTMINAVENRLGIIYTAAGVDKLYARKWEDLVSLSFDTDQPAMKFWLYYHKDIYRSNAINCFIDVTRSAFRT